MFEQCKDMASLNEARVSEIKSGTPAVLVNKEYAKRKAILLNTENRGFKRVSFVSVPVIEPEVIIGVDFAYEEDAHTIQVITEKMYG